MTITGKIDLMEIKRELCYFIRNQDIISTTTRGVTTATDTGTFSNSSSHLINQSNVKNIRSITVGGSTLSYGADYSVDLNYNDGGTIKCKIIFSSPQTGDYSIQYDYGTDKIYPDFPRPDLSYSSYPRIGVDIVSLNNTGGALGGGANYTSILVEIVCVADKVTTLDDMITSIREKIMENKKSFYNFDYIEPADLSPIIPSPDKHNKIFQRTITFRIPFQVEIIT